MDVTVSHTLVIRDKIGKSIRDNCFCLNVRTVWFKKYASIINVFFSTDGNKCNLWKVIQGVITFYKENKHVHFINTNMSLQDYYIPLKVTK